MRRWDGVVDRYMQVCETRGLSSSTLTIRRRELDRFGLWLKRRRPRPKLDEIDSDLLVRYIRDRTVFRARSTVSGVVSNLRGVGEFLVEEGLWRSNPLRWIRGPKIDHRRRVPRRIGPQQLRRLWDAAHARRDEHARYQGICILAILYSTGLRRGELERLDVDDWDREAGTLKIDGRKTGQARCVPVTDGVWRCIEAYLPRRHNRLERSGTLGETALLVSSRGRRIRGHHLYALLRRLTKVAGIPPVTLHQFRHSCASDLLESGVALPHVQRILGHAGIASTVRYTAVADPARAAAVAKHPINRFLTPNSDQGGQP